MRGQITDQDLTDYALNELEAADRLYVESMLAASEECRNDICKTIELAQLLESGFQREASATEMLVLKPEQREELSRPHFMLRCAVRDVISVLGLAACIALAMIQLSRVEPVMSATSRMAQMRSKVSNTVSQVVQTSDGVDMKATMDSLRAMVSDPSNWLPVSENVPQAVD